MALVKMFNDKRRAWVKTATPSQAKHRLRDRYCVGTVPDKAPKSAVRGVKMKQVEYHGCFVNKREALRVAEGLSKKKRL
jgi:hypothetical protein